MVFVANLGFPRIGAKRQLKGALEGYWNGTVTQTELLAVGKQLRLDAWRFQAESGLDMIPSNDFSFYDHVLDTIAMVGAVPERFQWSMDNVDLSTYFLMARGVTKAHSGNGRVIEAPAMEMTKWFNTNYHFIVPELADDQHFKLASRKCIDEFLEAKEAGIITRPVLLGPVSFLYLAKGNSSGSNYRQLEQLLVVYREVLSQLRNAGAQWVQLDEPCLSLDLDDGAIRAFKLAYKELADENLSLMLTTYFGALGQNLELARNLPVQGLHLDLVNGSGDLPAALENWPAQMFLSAGIIDGHNVWRCDLAKAETTLEKIAAKIGLDRLIVAPSCSLMHVPVDTTLESGIDPEVLSWLSFAKQKVKEISVLKRILTQDLQVREESFAENESVLASYKKSEKRNNQMVRSRLDKITPSLCRRETSFVERRATQQNRFRLPQLPTTTIGSFPQTKDIRESRKKFRAKQITAAEYEKAMQAEIANNIALQERIGLDVFVHGEPERTDMVEYFAQMLAGIVVSQHGWVQSYGSRYVRPPIVFGDVYRVEPMTITWAKFAQSLTSKPVKGMLTGPVTMLQWSFVRDDQPREQTCKQLALAIRDEVADLEAAGIKIIQIDEPAIREGLPLRAADWERYLDWSVQCFRLASSGVADDTQIHTHMCYSEFGDMVKDIAAMDADVISIEAARSGMDLLDSLRELKYPNDIGPGVYDIHSPAVPSEDEMLRLLARALKVVPVERLWVNPDCGLKTRTWEQVIPALNALVSAAQRARTLTAVPG